MDLFTVGCVYPTAHVAVRGQLAGVGWLLPRCGSRELNSGCQVLWQSSASLSLVFHFRQATWCPTGPTAFLGWERKARGGRQKGDLSDLTQPQPQEHSATPCHASSRFLVLGSRVAQTTCHLRVTQQMLGVGTELYHVSLELTP